MKKRVSLPELGENIDTAEVADILVKVGDQVEEDQPLLEVESDKASTEVPSTMAGKVAGVLVEKNDTVKVGQALVEIEVKSAESDDDTDVDSGSEQIQAADSAEESAEKGEKEQTEEKRSEPEKTEAEERKDKHKISEPEPSPRKEKQKKTRPRPVKEKPSDDQIPAPAAPSVRKFARELGVDINRVKGSGPIGRISVDDVKLYVKHKQAHSPGEAASAEPEMPDFSHLGDVEVKAFSGVRRAIANQMSLCNRVIPQVTHFDRADITRLEEFRKEHNSGKHPVKLSMTAILTKTVAMALLKFPKFNASIDLNNEEVIYKKFINIGIAVDTEHGLMVPVVKNADSKGLLEISEEIKDKAARARERKIKPDDLKGGNISITNLGGLGTEHFSPIVNWPEVAVLGLGRASWQYVKGEQGMREAFIMPLSLSYDHRLIDGADAARFQQWLKDALAEPLRISF